MTKKFTKKEIEALKAEGIMFEVDGRDIVVAVPYEGVMRDGLTWSDINQEETTKQAEKVREMFPGVGGYVTGWGGWHFRKEYENYSAGYDYCDVSSPAHY